MPWTKEHTYHVLECKKDPAYFIDNFVWMDSDYGIIPFNMGKTPDESHYYQREALEHFKNGENMVILKNRRAGLSWLASAIIAWGINFNRGWNALLLSKEESKAVNLLAKVKFILKNLAFKDGPTLEASTKADWLTVPIFEPDNQQHFGRPFRDKKGNINSTSSAISLTTTKKSGIGEKAKFVFIDEVQFIENQDEVFGSVLITAALNGSWMMGCVTTDTHIITEKGVEQIGKYVNESSPLGFSTTSPFKVYGVDGLQVCNTVFNKGWSKTRVLTTERNYSLECSLEHPLLVRRGNKNEWVEACNIKVGDYIALLCGSNVWGNRIDITDCIKFTDTNNYWRYNHNLNLPAAISPDLAYLLGLIVGDGYIGKKSVTIASKDVQTVSWLESNPFGLKFKLGKDNISVVCSSKRFVEFCKQFGMPWDKKAPEKYIPERIMTAPREIVVAFLSGLFDTDGHSETKTGYVSLTSSSRLLIDQTRYLLLNLGVVTSLRTHNTIDRFFDNHFVKGGTGWRLNLGGYSDLFYHQIGFRLSRKQENHKKLRGGPKRNAIPFSRSDREVLYKQLQKGKTKQALSKEKANLTPQLLERIGKETTIPDDLVVAKDYLWLKVNNISASENYTVDLSIPIGHSFVSNGLVSHNSNAGQQAGTRFHHLCLQGRAKENKSYWYREVWPWESGITQEIIDKSSEAYTEDIKRQEWYLEFGQPGNAVFNATHLAACYKPPDMYPEIKTILEQYRQEVVKNKGRTAYYVGVDSAVGKSHKKSNEKDWNFFTALTMTGIQAFTYYDQKPLSQWAGETIQNGAELTYTKGKVSELHAQWPGLALIEEEGPGYVVLNRYVDPMDGVSEIRSVSMKQSTKSRIIKNLIIAIESHAIVITDEKTYQQLSVYEYGETPDTYGAPIGMNDDAVMALALALDGLTRFGGFELDLGGKSLDHLLFNPQKQLEPLTVEGFIPSLTLPSNGQRLTSPTMDDLPLPDIGDLDVFTGRYNPRNSGPFGF